MKRKSCARIEIVQLKSGKLYSVVKVRGKKIYGNKNTHVGDCVAFLSGYLSRDLPELKDQLAKGNFRFYF